MSLGFRLSVVIFVFILMGLGMFWLSVDIVGKKVRVRPFLIYAVCFGVSYLLSMYISYWLFGEETVFSEWYNVLHSLICYTIEAAATYSPLFDRMYIYTFVTIVIPKLWAFFIAFLAAYVLRRSGFYRYFTALFSGRLKAFLIMFVSYLLMFVWTAIDFFYPNVEPNALYAI